mmetsp:Transcript_22411/g.63663  ORF Transcript_22411/g.63663 Transcript_22411/m.63663 type:complete len:182 (+) Transcript_22411:219-764(+)
MPDEGGDDEDGSLRPPLRAPVRGGGVRILPQQLGCLPMKLWSSDKDSQSEVGCVCVHDAIKRVLFAKLKGKGGIDEDGEATKSAIASLLDLAEACGCRKIALGLGPNYAGCAELICSLLYLGFQVVPSRKCPLVDTALLLEFDMGLVIGGPLLSDYTFTGTSECSTSAEDSPLDGESLDSD